MFEKFGREISLGLVALNAALIFAAVIIDSGGFLVAIFGSLLFIIVPYIFLFRSTTKKTRIIALIVNIGVWLFLLLSLFDAIDLAWGHLYYTGADISIFNVLAEAEVTILDILIILLMLLPGVVMMLSPYYVPPPPRRMINIINEFEINLDKWAKGRFEEDKNNLRLEPPLEFDAAAMIVERIHEKAPNDGGTLTELLDDFREIGITEKSKKLYARYCYILRHLQGIYDYTKMNL